LLARIRRQVNRLLDPFRLLAPAGVAVIAAAETVPRWVCSRARRRVEDGERLAAVGGDFHVGVVVIRLERPPGPIVQRRRRDAGEVEFASEGGIALVVAVTP